MAQRCDLCGKGPASGNKVSHSNRKTRRRFMPNIQQLRVVQKGNTVSIKSCTRCIRTLSKNVRSKNPKPVAAIAA